MLQHQTMGDLQWQQLFQSAWGEERKDTDVLHGEETPQCNNKHSWAPKPLRHLQFSWEHSSFTQAQGVYPEQDSDLRDKMDVCSLCTLAAPIFAGWLQVQSNKEQNTVFLIKLKIHSWHCIRWVPKAFQGQMKRLMAPSWGTAPPSSIHCQHRQPDQGRGCVVTEAPEPQATQLCSLYCTPKVAPRRTNSGLQHDPAPFQRVLCIQVKHRIPKTMANR